MLLGASIKFKRLPRNPNKFKNKFNNIISHWASLQSNILIIWADWLLKPLGTDILFILTFWMPRMPISSGCVWSLECEASNKGMIPCLEHFPLFFLQWLNILLKLVCKSCWKNWLPNSYLTVAFITLSSVNRAREVQRHFFIHYFYCFLPLGHHIWGFYGLS